MIERISSSVLCFVALGLSVGWWTWSLLVWRREHDLLRRLDQIVGAPIKQRGGFDAWIRQRLQKMRRRMRSSTWKRDLPDFFELLALAQSSGMSLPNAWIFSSRLMDGSALAGFFDNVGSLLRVGRSWDQALTAFALDIDDERCSWIVGLMRQNLRRGSPLAAMLVDQVEQWRYAESMEAEHKTQTLSLKLLLPIFLFLLPAVFIVLFAPILLRFSKGIPLF